MTGDDRLDEDYGLKGIGREGMNQRYPFQSFVLLFFVDDGTFINAFS